MRSKFFYISLRYKSKWHDISYQKDFLLNLCKLYNISINNINNITTKTIRENGGGELLKKYNNKQLMLNTIFPNENIIVKHHGNYYWSKKEHQKLLLEEEKCNFNINKLSDWLSLSSNDIRNSKLKPIRLKYYSWYSALRNIYPEYNWNSIDCWNSTCLSTWKLHDYQILFLKYIKIQENIEWKDLTKDIIDKYGGSILFQIYNSIQDLLYSLNLININDVIYSQKDIHNIYKEYNINNIIDFCLLTESQVHNILCQNNSKIHYNKKYEYNLLSSLKLYYPNDKWKDILKNTSSTHKKVLIAMCKHINKQPYKFYYSDFTKYIFGNIIIKKYENIKDIIDIYKKKLSSLWIVRPKNYWNDINNQKEFIKSLGKKYNLKLPEDLDKISNQQIISNGGRQLLRKYSSYYDLCKTLYPKYEWNLLSFTKLPRNTWDNIDLQREFLNNLMKQNNITSPTELANLGYDFIRNNGGRSIMNKYKTFYEMLQSIYPNENWNEIRKPRNYFENIDNIKDFINYIKIKYNIQTNDDWYRISYAQITDMGGETLLRKYGGLYDILCLIYPNEKWNKQQFQQRDKRSSQRWLFLQISQLFPTTEVIEEYTHQEMTRISGQQVQFDVFIPYYNLAFEYHGIHHYKDTTVFGPLELYKERDLEKQKMCKEHNINLIIIPYTWNNKIETLIKQYIPSEYSNIIQYKE